MVFDITSVACICRLFQTVPHIFFKPKIQPVDKLCGRIMLHNEKDTFEHLIMRTSEYHGVKAEKVERGLFYNVFYERDL